jgi:type I restriction enzyme, S subunit
MSNVPKLRFKEFSGEWEEITIGKVLSVGSGKDYKHLSDGDIPVYGTGGYMLSVNNYLYDGESVGIGRKGTIDKPIFLSGKFWTVDTLFYTHSFKNSIPKFIYPIFQRINWKLYNEASGVPSLSKSTIEKIKIFIPLKQEQEKIASFLTSVDSKIEQLTKKEELLQQYKKGVMQKIFNQEIRFKADDGSEFCEWKEKKLEDFLNLTLREVPKPIENYLAIGIRSHCKGTFQKPDSEPHKIAMDKLYIVKENDLIVNITFAWESAIAIVKKEDEGGLVSHRFPTYTFDNNLAIVEFFRYAIIQKKFRLMLDLISPGGAGRNRVMSKKDFLKLKWKLPCIEEQNKIANFLSSIDTKIQQTQKQLESSKEFKKSLLQQMFVQ